MKAHIELRLQTAYPMELHLVHYKATYAGLLEAAGSGAQDALAVLGIFFEIQTEDNAKLKPLIDAVKSVKEYTKDTKETEMEQMELKDFLPRNTDQFYRYEGGLTTPGCNEVVVWTVFKVTHKKMLSSPLIDDDTFNWFAIQKCAVETRNTRSNSFLALLSIENALDHQKNAFFYAQCRNYKKSNSFSSNQLGFLRSK